ncbi:hypothetical protein CsSME_00018215 [Camellia sinensis var. sinensis]
MNNTSGMFKIVPCTFAGDTSAAIADECITDMGDSVRAIEQLLNYRFNDKKLLEEALTHPSCTDSPSYQRLEFVGDAALGIAISNFIFLAYPDLLPGQLTLLRSANVSTEKLARAAVRHGLYKYVRRNAAALDEKVRDFTLAVQQEADMVVYGGMVKAPKVLADIVESVAAAVYVDRQFDLQAFWVIFRGILEPIVTLDVLQQQPQPVTMLFDFCQKEGKQVDIKHWRRGEKNIAIVYVDGEFIASSSSEQNENVRLHAAKAALEKLSHSNSEDKMNVDVYSSMNLTTEIEGAKQKLHDICGKKRWPKPTYRFSLSLSVLSFAFPRATVEVTLAATALPEIETTELSKTQPEEAVAAPPAPELVTEKPTEVAATTEEPAAAPKAEAPAVEAKIKEVVEEPEVAAEEAPEVKAELLVEETKEETTEVTDAAPVPAKRGNPEANSLPLASPSASNAGESCCNEGVGNLG